MLQTETPRASIRAFLPCFSLLVAVTAFSLGGLPGRAVAESRMTALQVLDAPHATAIQVQLDGSPAKLETFTLENPSRLVFEFSGVVNATGKELIEIGSPRAARASVSEEGSVVRVTVVSGGAVNAFTRHGVAPTERGFLLTVGAGTVVAAAGSPPPAPQASPVVQAPPSPTADSALTTTAATPATATTAATAATATTATTAVSGSAAVALLATAEESKEESAAAEPTQIADSSPAESTERVSQQTSRQLPPVSAPASGSGPRYTVTSFELEYAEDHPEQPLLDEIAQITVELGRTADGVYVAPQPGVPAATVEVSGTFIAPNDQFYASALRTINAALVREFNRRGLVAVLVVPGEDQIEPKTGKDLRPGGQANLRLVIFTGRAIEIRTFASGGVVPDDERDNNPRHQRILDRSPVQADGVNDLIRENELLDYASRLNRHPGRRVDVQISPARTPGGAYVDYLVTELKPWVVYSQFSNTGTESTTKWRQRFGFAHYQLSGHDDVLALDYVTGDFKEVHAVNGFYEVPIWGTQRFRTRLFGGYNQFDASVVGFPGLPYHGDSWTIGGDIVGNVFQYKDLFIDLFGGLRWAHGTTVNDTLGDRGETHFFLPRWGVQATRQTDRSAVFMRLAFEANLPGVANTDRSELQKFGRGNDIDDDWIVMRAESFASFYLEPLIFGDAWQDPSTPRTSTMAHEIYLKARGQYAFDNRLIPNEMQTVGGLYTVRGYVEAETPGDSMALGSLEYRLHVPRLFTPDRNPVRIRAVGPFKVVPQHVYGLPDWDFIVRAFFDVGSAWTTRAKSIIDVARDGEVLMGAGLGVELLLMQNLSARFDYGWALKSTVQTDSGNGEARFVIQVQY